MYYLFIPIIVILFGAITLNLHELSHCIVVWLYGGHVTSYKPYPHIENNRFRFGCMKYHSDTVNIPEKPLVHLAPIIKALLLLLVWFIVFIFHHTSYWLLIPIFWELSDIVNWARGYICNTNSDGGKLKRILNK